MRTLIVLCLGLVLSGVLGCNASSGGGPRDAGGDAGPGDVRDEDADGISDDDEGRATDRDSDGDGVPDYLDPDSDDDGIADHVEAGDDDARTAPVDSDTDGTPDFVDLDSDDNGILDTDERDGDVDGDRTPNYADRDDDGDNVMDVLEIAGMPSAPPDFDGDGGADYQDADSDADLISDGHERDVDTDMDGVPDARDDDSDADGVSDAEESGDADLATIPVDSDSDTVPDFRDTDSDNDGLADEAEAAAGTRRDVADSDGDMVSDLIEVAAGTDPTNGSDSPLTRGDFVFTVPYMEPPDPPEDTLNFRTSIQFADIYFLFDRSGSMDGEIAAMRSAVSMVMANLTCTDFGVPCTRDAECASGQVCSFEGSCIEDPGASSCIASPWTGTGGYLDTYVNSLSLQDDPARTSSSFPSATSAGTEELYEAVQCIADRTTCGSSGPCAPVTAGFVGCPNFREEAVRIIVAFTDEDSDGVTTLAQASGALTAAGVTFIGVWSGAATSTLRNEVVALATSSMSLDRTGAPLVFNGMDTSVVPVVTAAINEVVEGVPLRVTIDAADEPGDDGDSLQFIERLQTNTTDAGCTMLPTEDADMDGVHETYPAVTPGTPVCWDVIPRMNVTVMPDTRPLVFRARLTVRGDGSPLDSRLVFFLVPPRIPEPGGPG